MNNDQETLKRLIGSATSWADGTVCGIWDSAKGDSPIEKLLFTAIYTRAQLGATEFQSIWEVNSAEEEANLLSQPFATRSPVMIIRPQAKLDEGWRVDFLIHAYDWARKGGPPGWRRLIVECDGHDFHERTKEQAKRDRSRDRWATLNGYTILRFTGSEIFNEPWGCAEQITDWAAAGLP